ncbi:uncharacterized protein LOC123541208 [Mercenaria mercenaria]|uniref:uncharacterized protein LOC123541208 n=1 Tax=Mercenaria mercenaria TaxID=6596 RepID=UPI00234E4BFF|nr:uncharacterized protein LOC123541208 [Mercenaria mercenaria]
MAATLNDFLSEAVNIIESSVRVVSTNPDSIETLEAHVNILSALQTNIRRVSTRFNDVDRLSVIILDIIRSLEKQKRTLHPEVGFFTPTQPSAGGRPLYVISRDQLEYLRDNGFTTTQMADMLHVSQSSVKRRLRLYGLNIRQRYSTITDEQLDERVTQITRDNNALGQRMVQGMLRAEGTHVQRHRIAESLIRVNDVAVAMRWCTSIRRRVYQVSGPNALWHIDGNHKLIRWGFVIHGGIDGYSRVVTFLKVALNNRSETMQQAFFSGTDAYGVPSRLRSDHGLENVGVGAFMIAHRGANRGSFISGRSVHNQRIERLWRDLFQSCTTVYIVCSIT